MIVSKPVLFGDDFVIITGKVVRRYGQVVLVDFTHNGVEFRGLWYIKKCKILSR